MDSYYRYDSSKDYVADRPADMPYGDKARPKIKWKSKYSHGFAVTSLVLGIASILTMLCTPIPGIAAICFGGVAKSGGSESPMAISGLTMGIVSVVIWLVGRLIITLVRNIMGLTY